ncbi:MAG TPA: recombination regulator RecX [Burkholderiales bacterium]|nr:recombination regulator RecX [Burkholderiales bacterium]
MAHGTNLRAAALRLLGRREHSRSELRRKLSGEDVDPAELEQLLDELEQRGWLSETRLAEQMANAARGRYGPRRILERLRAKGVNADAVAPVIGAMKAQEMEDARAVWAKRFGKHPASLQERAKQARFLAGRGFSADVIQRLLSGKEPEGN